MNVSEDTQDIRAGSCRRLYEGSNECLIHRLDVILGLVISAIFPNANHVSPSFFCWARSHRMPATVSQVRCSTDPAAPQLQIHTKHASAKLLTALSWARKAPNLCMCAGHRVCWSTEHHNLAPAQRFS